MLQHVTDERHRERGCIRRPNAGVILSRALSRLLALPALVAVLLLASAAAAQAPADVPPSEDPEVVELLANGWHYMEASQLSKAEEAFNRVMAHPRGRSVAEVHFALAAVWWNRGNAMASYLRLQEAQRAAASDFAWDPGEDEEWDRRIAVRMDFIERNFTVVRLKFGSGSSAVPPLPDPAPADPLLRKIAEGVGKVIDEALEADARNIWLLLPNGTWWVGDDLKQLEGGEMDGARAGTWLLPGSSGRAARIHKARVDAIARGESPAKDRLEGSSAAAARLEAEGMLAAPHFEVHASGGGVAVPRQGEGAGGSPLGVSGHLAFGVTLPLRGEVLALTVGISAGNLPVSGCATVQTRSSMLAFGLGVRLARPVGTGSWLAGHLGVHVGGGLADSGPRLRQVCVDSRESAGAEPTYGVRLNDGYAVGVASYAALGWRGGSFAVGPEGDFGFLVTPPGARVLLGLSVFARHDQVFAVLDGGETRWFLDEESGALSSAELGSVSMAASMGRFQFGLRLRYLF